MNSVQIMGYASPEWAARTTGLVQIGKDAQSHYTVNNVTVSDRRDTHLFTTLTCVDGTIHHFFTVFFKQIDRPAVQ